MKQFIIAVVVIIACVGGYIYWQNHQRERALNDGAVTCQGCLTPRQEADYNRYDHGEGPRPRSDENIGSSTGLPANQPTSGTASNPVSGSRPESQFDSNTSISTRPIGPEYPTQGGMQSPPTHDTIAPNPPNGLAFAGTGSYQWYREGNLTWRVNTATGTSCIIYATMEEWRKRIVMDHGCGRNA